MILETLLVGTIGSVVSAIINNEEEKGESKMRDKEIMWDQDYECQIQSFWDYKPARRDESRAVKSYSNEVYIGETIKSPKNSVMLFNNCEFDNCTFIIES